MSQSINKFDFNKLFSKSNKNDDNEEDDDDNSDSGKPAFKKTDLKDNTTSVVLKEDYLDDLFGSMSGTSSTNFSRVIQTFEDIQKMKIPSKILTDKLKTGFTNFGKNTLLSSMLIATMMSGTLFAFPD